MTLLADRLEPLPAEAPAAPLEPAPLEVTLGEIRLRDSRTGRVITDAVTSEGVRVTLIGEIVDPEPGQVRTFLAVPEEHPRFGPQQRIVGEWDPELDAALAEGYLGSGAVAHIGPSGAAAIVGTFGAETIRRLMTDPACLLEFRGITPARLPAVRRSLRETVHLAPIIGLLDGYGVSRGVVKRVWRRHGPAAVNRIRANPWRLAREIRGIGFRTADRVAMGLGCPEDAPERLDASLVAALSEAATNEGHTVVPEPALLAAASTLIGVSPEALRPRLDAVVAEGIVARIEEPAGFALPSLADAEALIASKVRLMSSFADKEPLILSEAEIDRIEESEGISFDASQRRAIAGALHDRLTIITGGPGTGKTTIVRAILDAAERRGLSIALTSPTGRAARRLSDATGRPAQTIHRWLRFRPDEGYAGPVAIPDLLVVDEASMLDVPLAARIFSALPPFARILLVGDIDQLPAIGPGNVLGDLIAMPAIGVYRLRTIHRQAADSGVPALAAAIRDGIRQPRYDNRSTRFIERTTPPEIAEWIVGRFDRHRDRVAEMIVLCPMNRGPAGAHALNIAIQAVLNPPVPGGGALRREGYEIRAGDRVIVTGNDYTNELFNGDILVLEAIEADSLRVRLDDGSVRVLPSDAGGGFALAYAISIHRSQGSEFEVVIVPMHPSAYLLLERRLLYTAVSRARRTVAICGQGKAVSMAVGRHDPRSRKTALRELIERGVHAEPDRPTKTLDDLDEIF